MTDAGSGSPPTWRVVLASGRQHPRRATTATLAAGGELPYHATISRGLQRRVSAGRHGMNWVRWWPGCAPVLEAAWNATTTPCGADELTARILDAAAAMLGDRSPLSDDSAAELAGAAIDAGWCSFNTCADTAIAFLSANDFAALRRCRGAADADVLSGLGGSLEGLQIELRFICEGQTSSVLQVTARLDDAHAAAGRFVLNVARDTTDAAAELRTLGPDLTRWHSLDPSRAPAVLGEGVVDLDVAGPPRRDAGLPVLAVELLAGADELHVVDDPQRGQRGRMIRVAAFDHSPGVSMTVIGTALDHTTSDRVWADVCRWRTAAASIDWGHGTMVAPVVEINDGDVALYGSAGREEIAFVGSSAERFTGTVGSWPWELAASAARRDVATQDAGAGDPRVSWRAWRPAIDTIEEGLLLQPGTEPAVAASRARQMLSSALEERPGPRWRGDLRAMEATRRAIGDALEALEERVA